jgi:putative endonuclease
MWYVYILQCSDNSYYIGISNNLEKRLKVHNTGKGAKYTKTRLPVFICISWGVENRSIASKWEYKLKQLTRKQKSKLIELNCKDIEESYNTIK